VVLIREFSSEKRINGVNEMQVRVLALALLALYLSSIFVPGFIAGALSVKDVRSSKGLKRFLNKKVWVIGIFVRDPVPLLATDLKVVLVDRPMLKEEYLPLVGRKVKELNPDKFGGAKMLVFGLLRRPTHNDPPYCREEPAVLEVVSFKVLKPMKPPYSPKRYPSTFWMSFWKWFCKLHPKWCRLLMPARYAVLISGGYNEANNHIRYWNDLEFMYLILRKRYGYLDKNIYIFYANGVNPDPRNVRANFYSATITNLRRVFSQLRAKTKSTDTIFIFLNNHGTGYHSSTRVNYYGRRDRSGEERDGYDEGLCLWHSIIYDDEFARLLSDIRGKMIIVMKQCFSGGFIKELSGPRRIVISSCGENEFSWGRSDGNYGEFTFHFMAAVNGRDPYRRAVNADSNRDGKISMVEAFNYARRHDSRPEIPHYDDNGDRRPHTGNMPRGGDGRLGSATTL